MSGLTQDGTAERVSQDQIIRREQGQDNIYIFSLFPADHDDDWQSYRVHPYSAESANHTVYHTLDMSKHKLRVTSNNGLLCFIFSPPLRSDRGRLSRLLFFPLFFLFFYLFFLCSDGGMEREACVCL